MKYYRDAFLISWKEIIELIGLIFSVTIVFQSDLNWFSFIIMIVIVVSILIAIFSIIRTFREVKANAYYTTTDINQYMYYWLKNNNRAIIFSRDMSWANEDQKIIHILKKKAADGELTLILGRRTSLVSNLEQRGAKFIEYSFLDYIPQTRFTFVNYGSMDEKVAIGKKDENDVHRIVEYKPSDAPTYYLARDLISILIEMEKLKDKNEKN